MNEGSCLCGDITWEIDGPITALFNCHCSMCRKVHGTAFGTYAVAAAGDLRWTSGEERVARYRSSPQGNRAFCPRCGSVVADLIGDMAVAPAGNFCGEIDRTLDGHMFAGSKAPWHEITDSAPQFEAYPPEYGMPSVAVETRSAKTPGAVGGSCLCGAVAYEFDPPAERMVLCHCSRCRRSRSAAHSAQIFVAAERFRWLQGEDRIRRFKVPDAKYYSPSFCAECGSIMPRVWESGTAIIPAGSLDQDPGIRPGLHIFTGSKAPWHTITDTLPQYETLPPSVA